MNLSILKTRLVFPLLLAPLFLAAGVNGRAQTSSAAASAPRELSIVVVESLSGGSSRFEMFDRIARVFTEVLEEQKWPVKVNVERFAANLPAHETELRIFFKSISEETSGDLTFRAWMTLEDHGTKRDFGIVLFRYYPRQGEPMEDRLDRSVRGAAVMAVAKIRPILFPKANSPKP